MGISVILCLQRNDKITVVNKYTAPLLNGKPRASSTERTCRRNVSRIGGGGGGGGPKGASNI